MLVASASSMAGEKSRVAEILDSLPPMTQAQREAFDKAARSMYDAECDCLTFLMDGKVIGMRLPLSDSDRRLFILALEKNVIVPLNSSGPAH